MGSIPSGFSGSRASAVLGISPFATRTAAFQEMMEEQHPGWNAAHGYTLPVREESAAMRWGTAFEDAVAKVSAARLGGPVKHREKRYNRNLPGGARLTCHIDGAIVGKLYEAKTTSSFAFRSSWGKSKIPNYYEAQVQHNLMLTGLTEAVVVCLEFPRAPEEWEKDGWIIEWSDSLKKFWIRLNGKAANISIWAETLAEMGYFHTYEIAADKIAQDAMVEKYAAFQEKYLDTGTPPPAETYEDIKRLFPAPVGTLIVPAGIAGKIAEYKSIGDEISDRGMLGKRREELQVEILSYGRAHETVIDNESAEKFLMLDEAGNKVAQFGKDKNGWLSFRAS